MIAKARTLIPALVARVRELEEKNTHIQSRQVADVAARIDSRSNAMVVDLTDKLAAAEAKVARAHALADRWEHGALRWADPLPVPPAVGQLRDALKDGE
ncbi:MULTISPECIES: hypothetical protein [Rhodococcus]|uniref:hypothetical protein n=1 Tax=Rhodococcus TaxID=1827 RepID=UPI002954E52E|nr:MULTISPECIES: hypothetical protein [Rhodococcus]MDV7244505.1 hypothetical protein [Rhodococcus oxybenzonivorans]MDV7274252.1 hypothetical protein [Rhodococcus oxybenzonivorans]MDV7337862.1 hypothetical protein [Rhodococcus oxybenzonivorans]MDV7345202.1 hypothetical protein [Rhodococcus oxybenzonivorans]MDV8028891.1 hypothetical protein [Rhodococcus sp. IEGM 27]